MRKMLCTIVLIIFGLNIYAQDHHPFFDRCIEVQGVLRTKVISLQHKRDSLERIVDRFSKRSFAMSLDENALGEYLSEMSLSDIYANRAQVLEQMEYLEGSDLVRNYRVVIRMMEHLDKPYNRNTNEEDIKRFENIQVLDKHKTEFEALSVSVKDYRFVMFELGRIFRLIDRMENVSRADDVMKLLNANDELEFIYENIPYAVRILQQYVETLFGNDVRNFKEKKKELYEACPEAFPQFKSANGASSKSNFKGNIN